MQRLALSLDHDPAAGVENAGAVVVALLDIGRIGALHDRDEHLVADSGQAVSEEFDLTSIGESFRGCFSGAKSM